MRHSTCTKVGSKRFWAFFFGSMSGEETERSWESYCGNVLHIRKTYAQTKQTIERKNIKNKQAN